MHQRARRANDRQHLLATASTCQRLPVTASDRHHLPSTVARDSQKQAPTATNRHQQSPACRARQHLPATAVPANDCLRLSVTAITRQCPLNARKSHSAPPVKGGPNGYSKTTARPRAPTFRASHPGHRSRIEEKPRRRRWPGTETPARRTNALRKRVYAPREHLHAARTPATQPTPARHTSASYRI